MERRKFTSYTYGRPIGSNHPLPKPSATIHKISENPVTPFSFPADAINEWPFISPATELQFSNFWLKTLMCTQKHQIKWYCQGRYKTLQWRMVSFQVAHLFMLDLHVTSVDSFWKMRNGGNCSTRYSNRLRDFSVTIPRCYTDVSVDSLFPCTSRILHSLNSWRIPSFALSSAWLISIL